MHKSPVGDSNWLLALVMQPVTAPEGESNMIRRPWEIIQSGSIKEDFIEEVAFELKGKKRGRTWKDIPTPSFAVIWGAQLCLGQHARCTVDQNDGMAPHPGLRSHSSSWRRRLFQVLP